MTVGDVAMQSRLVACVGTGGVGKTTIAAAIALGAATRGRRVAALTIDPARQLARSLGLDRLASGVQPALADALEAAGIELSGSLDVGMLDPKRAWDAFIGRVVTSPALRDRVLANRFYQQLSTSFPGSNEYMAIEEVCRLAESDRYDLVVLDTPPAAHALEFLRAPERIDALLDRDVFDWLARPYEGIGRGTWRSLGAIAEPLARRLERAAGQSTLRDISSFLAALHGQAEALSARGRQARGLLHGAGTAFVLVARPQELALAETEALAKQLASLGSPLTAVVANRTHPMPDATRAEVADLIATHAGPDVAAWLEWAWDDVVGEAAEEQRTLALWLAGLPAEVARAAVPEDASDAHSLEQLKTIAQELWQRPSSLSRTAHAPPRAQELPARNI